VAHEPSGADPDQFAVDPDEVVGASGAVVAGEQPATMGSGRHGSGRPPFDDCSCSERC